MLNKFSRPIAWIALLSSALIVLAALVGGWIYWNSSNRENMSIELFKACLQLSFIGVVGAGITELYKRAQTQRDHRQSVRDQRTEACKDYLLRLGSAYRSAKAMRRTLKASGLVTRSIAAPQNATDFETYETAMKTLNPTQLELEALKIEAGARPEFARIEGLEKNLGQMEDYLREILKEYENQRSKYQPEVGIDFGTLGRLTEFCAGGDQFETKFSQRYEESIRLISSHLFEAIGPEE